MTFMLTIFLDDVKKVCNMTAVHSRLAKNSKSWKTSWKKRVDNGHPQWSLATVAEKPKALSKRSNEHEFGFQSPASSFLTLLFLKKRRRPPGAAGTDFTRALRIPRPVLAGS